MPCTYEETPAERAAARRTHDEQVAKRVRDELDPLLCSACRSLEGFNFNFDLNPALSVWWAKHKEIDEAREAKEAVKRWEDRIVKDALKKPFAKLSDEEKSLLKKRGYFK